MMILMLLASLGINSDIAEGPAQRIFEFLFHE